MRALRVSSVQEVNELFFRGTGEDGCLDAGALQAAVETFGYALSDYEAARAVAKLAAMRGTPISAASGMPEAAADGVQAATVTRSQLQCFLESVEAEWAYYPLKVVGPSAAIDILDGRLDGFSADARSVVRSSDDSRSRGRAGLGDGVHEDPRLSKMLKDSKRPLFRNLLAAGDVEEGQATGQLGFDDIDRATFLRECGDRLHTWRMLYCGGAKPVSDALKAISKDLGISFRKESFAW